MRSVPLSCLIFVVMLVALGAIFLWVPTEKEMGIVQRIFYFHVPAAFSSFLAFFLVFVGSVQYLRTRGGQVGSPSAMLRRIGRDLCVDRADHWALVGQTHLGSLLAMGAAPDLHADYFHHLRGLPNGAGIRG